MEIWRNNNANIRRLSRVRESHSIESNQSIKPRKKKKKKSQQTRTDRQHTDVLDQDTSEVKSSDRMESSESQVKRCKRLGPKGTSTCTSSISEPKQKGKKITRMGNEGEEKSVKKKCSTATFF